MGSRGTAIGKSALVWMHIPKMGERLCQAVCRTIVNSRTKTTSFYIFARELHCHAIGHRPGSASSVAAQVLTRQLLDDIVHMTITPEHIELWRSAAKRSPFRHLAITNPSYALASRLPCSVLVKGSAPGCGPRRCHLQLADREITACSSARSASPGVHARPPARLQIRRRAARSVQGTIRTGGRSARRITRSAAILK
jgi:hypothetical protein